MRAKSITIGISRLLLIGAAVLLLSVAQSLAQGKAAHNPIAGKPLAEQLAACANCHGRSGNSELPEVPSLAGQPELFLVNQLILFREGLRRSEAMSPFAQDLDDTEIIALAAHLSKLAPQHVDTTADPEKLALGAAVSAARRCGVCHLENYQGREQIPRIASQREDYLVKSMTAFRDNQRSGADTNMTAALYGIADAEIGALAHYLSRKP